MNPGLGLNFYTDLFRKLKELYPALKLHALGPPEIVFLAKQENKSYDEILSELVKAGLDSLPGAGAEILSDRVRKIVSPAKARSDEWLGVMRAAHRMNLPTSATMMYGHIETDRERIEHLIRIRDLQDEKKENHFGFITFIPWPFQDEGTVLFRETRDPKQLLRTRLYKKYSCQPYYTQQYQEHTVVHSYCRKRYCDVNALCRSK